MTDQCNRCRFWFEDMKLRDPRDENWGFGSCRRAPPVIVDCLMAAQIERPVYGQQIDLESRHDRSDERHLRILTEAGRVFRREAGHLFRR
jgi:hypothetical protein